MSDHLITYLHDHLAGARFAVTLLHDLSGQKLDAEVAELAAALLPEIEADRSELEDLVKQLGGDSTALKDVAAWVAQKASRFKLSLSEPIGRFEAIEMLCLGVLGKLSLWNALGELSTADSRIMRLNLPRLIACARDQHQRLETLRLKLAIQALSLRA